MVGPHRGWPLRGHRGHAATAGCWRPLSPGPWWRPWRVAAPDPTFDPARASRTLDLQAGFAYLSAIPHADVRSCGHLVCPRPLPALSLGAAVLSAEAYRKQERRTSWHFPNSTCARCSSRAPTSVTRPTAGTRRWSATSSDRAPTSTSSTCRRPSRCCIKPCSRCARSPHPAAACCSWAPSARRRIRWLTPPSAVPSITSTTAGWAARSPIGAPSPAQ